MEEKSIALKRTFVFCAVSFLAAWILTALIPLAGLYDELQVKIIFSLCMFMPTVGNLLTRLITKQGFRDLKLAPRFKGNGRYYAAAYGIFILLIYLGVALYFLIYRSQFDPHAKMMSGDITTTALVLNLAVSTLIAPIVNIIPTLGEEFGWRGYLLYQLQEVFGKETSGGNISGGNLSDGETSGEKKPFTDGSVKAVLLTGVIWGFWHAPMITLGHNYGTGYVGYPVTGILMMALFCVCSGIIEGYYTLKTGSAIPAAICHSAINALASVGILFMNTTAYSRLIGPLYCGIIPLIPTILCAAFFLWRMKKEADGT